MQINILYLVSILVPASLYYPEPHYIFEGYLEAYGLFSLIDRLINEWRKGGLNQQNI